jgi:type VI secretion system VasD/TssJ family lipoprotein
MPTPWQQPRTDRATCIALLAGLLLVAGCASGPYQAELLATGGAKLNPTLDDKPSAVNIRIVQMVDRQAFENASDDDLREDPPKLAQGTWVAPHKDDVVYVGQKNWIQVEIKPNVRFLGVLGIFNEGGAQQRQLLDVGELGAKKLVFDGYAIELMPRSAEDSK